MTSNYKHWEEGWRGVGLEVYLDSLKKVADMGMSFSTEAFDTDLDA